LFGHPCFANMFRRLLTKLADTRRWSAGYPVTVCQRGSLQYSVMRDKFVAVGRRAPLLGVYSKPPGCVLISPWKRQGT
jgi:hypothetical protein